MKPVKYALFGLLLGLPVHCTGAELWVDRTAAPGGEGSSAKPFQTITQAIQASHGGDTITIRKGTYAESLPLDKSGTAQQPTVLRAATSERVIISGFSPIGGWQPHRDHIYTTTADWPAGELFVGYAMQPVARWPDGGESWRRIDRFDPAAGTLHDAGDLAREKELTDLASRPAAARLYLYLARGNVFGDAPLAKLDPTSSTLTTGQAKSLRSLTGKGDRYQIVNHVSLITAPGQWASEPADAGHTRFYFWPRNLEDLQHTQARRAGKPLIRVGRSGATTSHVRVEGLEVTGGAGPGIEIGGADHVNVTRCTVHHNSGTGIGVRRCAFIDLSENISLANQTGVGIASSHDLTIQRNEIALNMVDGLVVAGNVTGRPGGEPGTRDVLVKRNYIHHHLLLSHPDNMQTYRDVERLTIEENVLLWGGQGLMTEETNHGALRDCVVVGTGAIAVIFGHSNANDWTVERCTIGLGGWGALSLTGRDYRLDHDIFLQNMHALGETVASDYNIYTTSSDKQPIALVSKPKWRTFFTPADAAAATGQESHSLRADPLFRSAPTRQAVATWDDRNTRARLFVRQSGADHPTDGFSPGDRIELNGDGVPRRLTAVDDDSLQFDPPLPQLPLRSALVWNWKDADKPVLDLRPRDGSPALSSGKDGGRIGADLDIPAYQRGDFDGDGKRDLPELPDDLKAAWPNPNAVVMPLHGA